MEYITEFTNLDQYVSELTSVYTTCTPALTSFFYSGCVSKLTEFILGMFKSSPVSTPYKSQNSLAFTLDVFQSLHWCLSELMGFIQ